MVRTVLIELALFLTPFALYALLLLVTRGSAVPRHWSLRALVGLSGAALALMVAGLLLYENERSVAPGHTYVPAQMKDGVFVPGRYE